MNKIENKKENQNCKMSKKTKHNKLIKTHTNNITISDMNLKDKYTNFEISRLNESETLLYEINVKPKYFKRYGRGRIIRVRFGVNVGSEFSGDHFAIVISKNDTAFNPVLHVIPITSKKHKSCINIGKILVDENKINNLKEQYSNSDDDIEKKKIKECLKYYEGRKNVTSYAIVEHLKTVSKLSIAKPINEYDYIDELRISEELLQKIYEEIIKEFTL